MQRRSNELERSGLEDQRALDIQRLMSAKVAPRSGAQPSLATVNHRRYTSMKHFESERETAKALGPFGAAAQVPERRNSVAGTALYSSTAGTEL